MTLLGEVRSLLAPAVVAVAPDSTAVPGLLAAIKPAGDAKNGDYQANFAMALAKSLGRKPQDVAADVVAKLPATDAIESATVAGPGFINIRLNPTWLAEKVRAMAADTRLGVAPAPTPRTIVIDYSGPNVAKPLHVGHLRSTIIGDSLVRLLRFLGHTVVADNHLGDWGTQFGMLIYGYRTFLDKKKYDSPAPGARVRELARLYVLVRQVSGTIDLLSRGFTHHRDEEWFAADPIAELTRVYVNGVKRAGEDDGDDEENTAKPAPNPVADAYRNETAKLHAGDADNLKLWNEFMPACMDEIHAVYTTLGILPFDHEHGESYYQPMLGGVVDSLQNAGVSEAGDGGSVIVRTGKDGVALIRKRDGAYTYTTTDLATIQYRMMTWKPNAILYVVDFRQAHHFATVFETAKKWGHAAQKMQHVSFGSVLGKDGKPLQTRAGGATELAQLLERAVELGGHKFQLTYWQRKAMGHDVPDWDAIPDAEKQSIAEAVGIGAVKYADLSQNRTSDYKFDFDKMLATDGNTGTYMQYAYARCRSIFRKGDADEARFRTNPPAVTAAHPAERALCLQLLRFEDALQSAAAEAMPHHITGYLWDLAKAFSVFFEGCPVLKAETPDLRDSRLLLTDLTGRVIRQALNLLGIRTVERM
ncbi:MAG: arginine--tRNA ligase [Fimbriiglobus sp.]